MSFTRVNPGGWSVGASLTSAQQNQLDTNVSNALDKSAAGDSIAGTVNFTGSGNITANQASAIVSTAANGITSGTSGGIRGTAASAIQGTAAKAITTTIASGIAPGVSFGISDGGFNQGICATVVGGISDGGIAKGIGASVAQGICDGGVAAGIATTTAGGFQLGGGSTDWPTFSAPRSRTNITHRITAGVLPTNWAYYLSTGNNPLFKNAVDTVTVFCPIDFLHMGGTLTGLGINFMVGASHSSLPATLPSFQVLRFDTLGGNNGNAGVAMFSGGSQSLGTTWTNVWGGWTAPTTGAGWYASGNTQGCTLTIDQNNVLSGRYTYVLGITDESGVNSAAGNFYLSYVPFIASIPNMAFA